MVLLQLVEIPSDWYYFENLRSNVFQIREKHYCDAYLKEDNPRSDRPDQDAINQLKDEIQTLENDKRNIRIKTITLFISASIACLLAYFLIFLPMYTDPLYKVIRIIDGDTFEIEYKGKPTSVQLIGVNAPEPNTTNNQLPEAYSEEATIYLRDFLLEKTVYFVFDQSKYDKHKRILAYAYRSSDNVFVNLELIREGYAEVDLRYPFKHKELFMDYESRAKYDRKGLWGIHHR